MEGGSTLLWSHFLVLAVGLSVASCVGVTYPPATQPLHQRSPQSVVFRAKELAKERGGNIRIAVSFDNAHKQNLQTIQSFKSSAIVQHVVLPNLSMLLIEAIADAPTADLINIVRAIHSVPGATVEVDSLVFLFEELEDTKLPHIRQGFLDTPTTPNDPLFVDSWALHDIRAPDAWKLLSEHKRQDHYKPKVVLIGTGVHYSHPDLVVNVWTNHKELSGDEGIDDDDNKYVDDVHGWNAITRNGDPSDDHGHGTYIAGILGATANNGVGGVGVAAAADIIPCKFINADGWGYLMDAILCIDYAIAVGADIICNTFASDEIESSILLGALNNARQQLDYIFVTPAGSSGQDLTYHPFYPAAYDTPNVVSVAAITSSNKLLRDSNYGKTTVDLGSPGEGVKSLSINGIHMCKMGSGASAAAAYVAGVAAMMKTLEPTANCEELKDALASSVSPFRNCANVVAWSGKLNAFAAVKTLLAKKSK